ncbi:MAG: methylated-DNA--[protein]-cysteine S-methyltransferase [Syntrophotaleaceae bacterium]
MHIDYRLEQSVLGWLLLAATERGVCLLMVDDSKDALLEELAKRFPQAQLNPQEDGLRAPVQSLVDWLAGRAPQPQLPLDEQGTAFQRRVWQELRRIPCGEQIAYGELARRIGQPTAVRAVAGACARNPVALLTPCHRVVRQNGELGGYRWGVERKRRLLAMEQGSQGKG